jgi:hypothetical protein
MYIEKKKHFSTISSNDIWNIVYANLQNIDYESTMNITMNIFSLDTKPKDDIFLTLRNIFPCKLSRSGFCTN